jgi:hypothetical protein
MMCFNFTGEEMSGTFPELEHGRIADAIERRSNHVGLILLGILLYLPYKCTQAYHSLVVVLLPLL